MDGHVQHIIHVYVTPSQLRKMAADLERQWEQIQVGDNVPYWELDLANGDVCRITLDQGRMNSNV